MPSDVEGAPTRAEIVARFQEQTGLSVADFPFYFCFGLFRLTVIGQQIYYRYYHGMTKDERFRGFLKKSVALQKMCDLIIKGEITT